MAGRSSHSCAIDFAGFPIHVSAYSLVQSPSAQSFKNLCPCHKQPVSMPKVCSVTGDKVDAADMTKGVEVAKGDVRELPPEAAEAITSAEKSSVLSIAALPLAANVPTHLATGRFALVPNAKVPGSDQPVSILWNGLLASGRALMTEWVTRAGSRNKLVAIFATDEGLIALELPYCTNLNDAPAHKFQVNEQAAQAFETFAASAGLDLSDEFDHATFVDAYGERRAKAVEQALAGEPISVAAKDKADAAPVADLMAAMTAALASAKPVGVKPARKPKDVNKTAKTPTKKVTA